MLVGQAPTNPNQNRKPLKTNWERAQQETTSLLELAGKPFKMGCRNPPEIRQPLGRGFRSRLLWKRFIPFLQVYRSGQKRCICSDVAIFQNHCGSPGPLLGVLL